MIDPIDFSYLLLRLKLERHEAKKGFVSASASALSSLSFSQLKSRMEVVSLRREGVRKVGGGCWQLCVIFGLFQKLDMCVVFRSICVYRCMVKLFKV